MVIENIKLAFKSLLTNKLRTLLSLLGIVIGVMAVVTILTLGQTVSNSITGSLDSAGTSLISLYVRRNNSGIFTRFFGDELMEKIQGIESVIPLNSSSVKIRHQKEISNFQLYATESNWYEIMSYDVEIGEWFTADQNLNKRQVIILGHNAADELFNGENPVGKYVTLYRNNTGKSYQVIGVMKEKDSTLSLSFNDSVYIPYNTYIQRYLNAKAINIYSIRVKEGFNTVTVSDNIRSYLETITDTRSFTVFSSATFVQVADEITGMFSAFLAAVAGISLLVGGIGIMNIMLVTVAERTREIGIRKALGASPRVIRGQFLTEAIALTLLGAIIGVVFGVILSKVLTDAIGMELSLSLLSFIIAAGFSFVIGIFFGWYPAGKAARLNPIDALSYE